MTHWKFDHFNISVLEKNTSVNHVDHFFLCEQKSLKGFKFIVPFFSALLPFLFLLFRITNSVTLFFFFFIFRLEKHLNLDLWLFTKTENLFSTYFMSVATKKENNFRIKIREQGIFFGSKNTEVKSWENQFLLDLFKKFKVFKICGLCGEKKVKKKLKLVFFALLPDYSREDWRKKICLSHFYEGF